MPIEERRYISIKDKIITKANVQQLAKIVYAIYKRGKKADDYFRYIRFSVNCDDSSSFSSTDPSIFDDDSPINTKRVKYIIMKYTSSKSGESVEIDLTQTNYDSSSSNFIRVEGDNSNWVNGTLKKT